jgi:endonuclease/exonuclease/phosphatase family metal-dependent hydrolase
VPPTEPLRVATANSASGRDQLTGQPARTWAAAVAELDVDVLAVQEVDHLLERSGRADQTAEINAACARGGPAWSARFAPAVTGTPGSSRTMRPASATTAGEPSYGVALLSRHPVREWHELRLAPSRVRLPVLLPPAAPRRFLWAPDEQRVALAAEVAAPGGDVTVVCTHLSFAPLRAVAQLREIVRWTRALPRPLVLLGDLNLPGRVPARLTGWSPVLRAPTYPAWRPRVQLDHVLVDAGTGDVRVVEATTLPVGGSDHRALRAELAVGSAVDRPHQ